MDLLSPAKQNAIDHGNQASRTAAARRHRTREIAEVLARHGLAYLVGVIGLERLVPFRQGFFRQAHKAPRSTPPEHVRIALEELGATFVKLGQIVSTRSDLLPPHYQAELAKLQDNVPPVPFEAVREVIAAELGRPIETVYASFDPVPLAAASIGQAHAATLTDGTEVVVKVRRPGVVEQIEQDLEILTGFAATASRRWALADEYDVVGLTREFAETLRAEVDYIREARNAERIAANFHDEPSVHIPGVFWEATTARVLTLERVRGIKISDVEALDAAGIDRHALAETASRLQLKMVFEDGFFHADPHPGNLFVEPDGRIGLVDFGMVGILDEAMQEQLAGVFLAVTSQDTGRLADALLEVGVARGRIDRDAFERDLRGLLSRYYDEELGEIAIAPLIEQAFAIVRRHRLLLPPKLALLLKTVVMSEGLGARLYPSFRLATILEAYAERLVLRQYAPLKLARRLGQASLEAAHLGVTLPAQLRRLIGDLQRGSLEVGVRPEHFEPLVRRLERLVNRLVLGVLAASFIIGMAILMAAYRPPGWEPFVAPIFAFGFAAAAILGTYVIWAVLRSGRG
jgi:ubiquinone biosynthesis protein